MRGGGGGFYCRDHVVKSIICITDSTCQETGCERQRPIKSLHLSIMVLTTADTINEETNIVNRHETC